MTNNTNNRIHPRKPRKTSWKIGTFDLETRPVGEESSLIAPFCMGATCLDGTAKTVQLHFSPVSMLLYMLSKGDKVRWFAHNGAGFDFKYFLKDEHCLDVIKTGGYTLHIIGGDTPKALMLKRGHKTIIMADSYKIMPDSLKRLCESFQVPVQKGFIDFEGGEIFNPNSEDHKQYLKDDVISLSQVIECYRNVIKDNFGTDLKCTASSTAFTAWQTTLQYEIFHNKEEADLFFRQCYHGARTECFDTREWEGVYYIDVNSLYAYIMYEYGAPFKPVYTNLYERGNKGFYKVKATVPLDWKFGPLPVRKKDGSGIRFPVGTFTTFVCSCEIELALDMGAKIEIIEGYEFAYTDDTLYRPFLDVCKRLRKIDPKGALGNAGKFLQNNLYGFFGMNPDRTAIAVSEECPGEDYAMYLDADSGKLIPHLWQAKTEEITSNMIPAFAAWITAHARVHLTRAILKEEQAGNNVLYCDTDSIVMVGTPVNDIDPIEYGKFKTEHENCTFKARSGKTYRLIDGDKIITKCKGIPSNKLTPDMFDDEGQKTVSFTQLNGLIQIIKGDNLGSDSTVRTVPNPANMTTRLLNIDGTTSPWVIND